MTSIESATRKQDSRPMPNWPRNWRRTAATSDRFEVLPMIDSSERMSVFGEADAVVADHELLVAAGGHDLDRPVDDGMAQHGPGPDGVVRVLHELAQVDPLVAVEVVAEDLDEAPQVNRELLPHASPPFPARVEPRGVGATGLAFGVAPQILRSCSIRASLNRAMARLARARSSTR